MYILSGFLSMNVFLGSNTSILIFSPLSEGIHLNIQYPAINKSKNKNRQIQRYNTRNNNSEFERECKSN